MGCHAELERCDLLWVCCRGVESNVVVIARRCNTAPMNLNPLTRVVEQGSVAPDLSFGVDVDLGVGHCKLLKRVVVGVRCFRFEIRK